ncbi:DUF2142 domain-containing protein [Curtobacterium sp. MCBD17_035]|uniref:DUF2142 domain-containing protein n=1 Tax=Curtobacterium sp. MCBD17_035 TaxID=2175673 RepID=UPI000DA79112|nr:DUF2142 domain-containing protein [Curtobacterium sp. MCBD17_035]WIB66406.1 DUF2142 domain-containing protein [Curtobacterium sp. MCBD17_035]
MAIDAPPITRRERIAVVALTVAFGLVLALWAVLTPLFHTPDEAAHVDAVVHVARGDGWAAPGHLRYEGATVQAQALVGHVPTDQGPTWGALERRYTHETGVNQMTQHPPTYYVLAAGVLHLVHYEHLRYDLVVLTLRLFDALLVLALPLLAWATTRRLTGSPAAALVGGAAVLAVPQVAQIGASASNDPLVMLAGALVTWLGVRVVTGDVRRRTLLALSVALGLTVASKATGLPAIPFVAVAAFWSGVGVLRPVVRAVRALVALAVAGVLGGWWWLHNIVVYHALQPNGLIALRPDEPWTGGATPNFGQFFNSEWTGLGPTFWGDFGRAQFPMTPVLTDLLTIVGIGGIVVWGFRRGPALRSAIALAVFPAFLVATQLLNNWQSYDRTQFIGGVQGRYFFPGIVALVALSALAWRRAVLTPAGRARFGRVALVTAVLVAAYGVTVGYRGFWEKNQFLVTQDGLHRLASVSPVGGAGVTVLTVLLGVALVVAAVTTWWAIPAAAAARTRAARSEEVPV